MSKIMLVRDFAPSNIPYPSQALGILGTMLFNKGHQVRILDNNSNYRKYNLRQVMAEIAAFSPDILGVNINTFNARQTYRLVAMVKETWPKMPIVGGGIHMKYCFQEALDHQVDVVVNNEGDTILFDLMDAVSDYTGNKAHLARNLKSVRGISYYDENRILHSEPMETMPVLKDLDTVPFINYELFNLKDYLKIKNDSIYIGFIVAQRGCPYPCNFCSETYLIGNIRDNSSDYIIEYIKYLNRKYDCSVIGFGDNNFTLSKKRTMEVCHKIIEGDLNKKISFYCQTNVKTNLTKEMADALKSAGFGHISLGIERMTEDGKNLVNKYITDEKIQDCINIIRASRINVNFNMLIGFPWDTKELVLEEKRLFERFSDVVAQVQSHILVPLPGTEYYDSNPTVAQWYLDDSFFKAYDTYFAQVLSLYLGPDFIKLNPFKFPPETLEVIKNTYYVSLIRTYIKRTDNFNNRFLFLVVQFFDLLLAGLSFLTYKVSDKLEAALFTKLKQLRFLLATRFAVKKIADGDQSQVVESKSVQLIEH